MSEITADEFTERAMCRILDSARREGKDDVEITLPSVDTILAITDEIEKDEPCLICGKRAHEVQRSAREAAMKHDAAIRDLLDAKESK